MSPLPTPSSARDALDGNRSSESATLPENVNQAIEEVRNPVGGGGGGVLPLFAALACSTCLLLAHLAISSFLKLLWRNLCTAGKRELSCTCALSPSNHWELALTPVTASRVCFRDLLKSEAFVDEVRQGLRCIAVALTERAAKVHMLTPTHTRRQTHTRTHTQTHTHTCAHTLTEGPVYVCYVRMLHCGAPFLTLTSPPLPH